VNWAQATSLRQRGNYEKEDGSFKKRDVLKG